MNRRELQNAEQSLHVLLWLNGDWILVGTFDPDRKEESEAYAKDVAQRLSVTAIIARTAVEFSE